MKKSIMFLTILSFFATAVLVSCDKSEDEPVYIQGEYGDKLPPLPEKKEIDRDALAALLNSDTPVFLTGKNSGEYVCHPDENPDNLRWEVPAKPLPGLPFFRMRLVIYKNAIYENVFASGVPIPTMMENAWYKYCKDEGKKIKIYSKLPTEFDLDEMKFSFYDTKYTTAKEKSQLFFNEYEDGKLRVSELIPSYHTSMESDDMILSYYHLVMTDYAIDRNFSFDGEENLAFDTDRQAWAYIFEKLKSKYGRYVNVQGIIPGVEFEDPIIDLEQSEKYYSEYPSPWD